MADDYVKMLQEGTGQPVSILKLEVLSERRQQMMDLMADFQGKMAGMPFGMPVALTTAEALIMLTHMQAMQIDIERQDERLRRLEEMVLCR